MRSLVQAPASTHPPGQVCPAPPQTPSPHHSLLRPPPPCPFADLGEPGPGMQLLRLELRNGAAGRRRQITGMALTAQGDLLVATKQVRAVLLAAARLPLPPWAAQGGAGCH